MSFRRVDTGPELGEVESLAADWSESPHHPALSEDTRLQLAAGNATVFVAEGSRGVATLCPTKRAGIGMVEIAVRGDVTASDLWDHLEPAVKEEAVRKRYRALELLTWDPGLRGILGARGWHSVRTVNRGMRGDSQAPLAFGGGTSVEVFDREADRDGLLEVNNLALGSHPEAGDWDNSALEARFAEPWFDPAGIFVTRAGSVVTGFCWTKIHGDGVGEIYLLAVRPSDAGHGLGRALVTTGIEYLTTGRGCSETMIYWDASNAAASNLYQSIGFSVDLVGEVFRDRG